MVHRRNGPQRRVVQVTPQNYQAILLMVLRRKNPEELMKLAQGAAQAGIADAEAIGKLRPSQWEAMLHKLRAVHPQLTEEERAESNAWCIGHGVYPGGHFEHDTEISKL